MPPSPARVVFVGPCGSGKSTLGAQLAAARWVPHIELDALQWEPNWVEAPDAVMADRLAP
ncbi:MAG: hypothetical protein IPK67_19355 [Planctomycetes bacterium]|nr:hypothetical protein [Planctomycetota bacterium]